MKLSLAFLLLLLGGFCIGWRQHQEIAHLRAEITSHREALPQTDPDGTESAISNSPTETSETKDPASFRGEHEELIKLRGQVSLLRKVAPESAAQLQQQLGSLRSKIEAERRAGEFEQANQKAKELAFVTRGALKVYASTIRTSAKANGGRLPQSLDEINRIANAMPEGDKLRRALDYALNEEFEGVSWATFEFIPQASPSASAVGPAFILRERQPRHLPDGTTVRAYANASGEVQELPEVVQP